MELSVYRNAEVCLQQTESTGEGRHIVVNRGATIIQE